MIIENLPVEPTSFVGRTEELSEINNLLNTSGCRLLTLVGPGGIGKTRLAVEAARQTDSFTDGIYFIPLQSLGSPDQIISTIAGGIDFQFFPGGDPTQQLFSFLHDKHLLLLLDNFEHLLDSADLISDLLSTTPTVQIMITSRERLNLSSETIFPVAGLPVPGPEPAENVTGFGAVELFMQGAHRVHRGFSAEQADMNTVADICRLVGGMPLAILLSAAWVDLLSLPEIAGEIERGLEFLETEMRDIPVRHRSVRATFDASWERLSAEERDVFKKLSVFRGGFSHEAAQSVAGASLKMLASLVNKSFVQTVGNGRYDVHELLRQYGATHLKASEEQDQVKALHAGYYAEFIHQRHLDYRGPEVKPALRAVSGDYDNIRAAWDETIQQGRSEDLWKLVYSFFDFSWHLNHLEDAFNVYTQVIEEIEATGASEQEGELLVSLLTQQAVMSLLLARDFDPHAYQRAVTLLRRHPPSNPTSVRSLYILGFYAAHRVELSEGEQLIRDGIALCRTRGYLYEEAEAIIYLMVVFSNHHINWAEMAVLNEAVFEILKQLNSAVLLTFAQRQQGIILFEAGSQVEAKPFFAESFRGFQESGDVIDAMACLDYLAAIAYNEGNFAEALDHYRLMLTTYNGTVNSFHIPLTLEGIAKTLAAQGKREQAVELCSFLLWNPNVSLIGPAPPGIAPLLEQLEAEFPPELFAALVERGKALDRDTIIRDLLAELNRPEPLPVAHLGLHPLSERECEVAALIASGKSNSELADELVLSKRTVEKHIANILSKLGFTSRAQIVRWAIENGLTNAHA